MFRRASWLLAVVLLVAPTAAQTGDDGPLSVQGPGDTVFLHGGQSADLDFQVVSTDVGQSYHLRIEARLPDEGNWQAQVQPEELVLASTAERTITVTVTADDRPAPRAMVLRLVVTAVGEDFASHVLSAQADVQSTGTDSIMGRWDNPLPAPLDNQWGSFALNLLAWWALAFIVKLLVSPTLKVVTLRTKSDLDNKVIQIIARPVFLLIFTFGIVQSLEVFALPAWTFRWMARIWTTILGVVIVYIAYKLWNAVVLALGRRVARRTSSELDDRLYPVFEKVGGIIILIVGLFFILSSYGVDLTLFAAGGAVASLVIAFAAQDTLANFFAGIFILLDRPFQVGDRIELPEQETWGDVQHVGLRTTRIVTRDNRTVIMPNNLIGSNPVINHSYPDPFYRIEVHITVPYGSDVEYVRNTLIEAVKPVEGVHKDKPVEALLLEYGDNGLMFRLRWWINSYVDTRRAFDRVNSAVIKQMAIAGIRIPYPQRVWWDAHKLLERESAGGLSPVQLSEAEREVLERQAEQARKKADRQEAEDIAELKREAKERRRTGQPELEEREQDKDDVADAIDPADAEDDTPPKKE